MLYVCICCSWVERVTWIVSLPAHKKYTPLKGFIFFLFFLGSITVQSIQSSLVHPTHPTLYLQTTSVRRSSAKCTDFLAVWKQCSAASISFLRWKVSTSQSVTLACCVRCSLQFVYSSFRTTSFHQHIDHTGIHVLPWNHMIRQANVCLVCSQPVRA